MRSGICWLLLTHTADAALRSSGAAGRGAAVVAMCTPTEGGFSDISGTSSLTRGIVASLTRVVNAIGGGDANAPVAKRERRGASLTSEEVLEGLRADFVDNEYLWSGKITPELYDEDCIFTDPTLSFAGLSTFETNLENLDPYINRFVPPSSRSVELKALRFVDEETIEAEWRMLGQLQLPWKPRLDLDGRTRYTLGGEGGRITSYDESWAITPAEALWQLVKPYRGGE